ncbi:MAG: leucyl aminopeptidase [Candidatus Nanopelagicales bacterium]
MTVLGVTGQPSRLPGLAVLPLVRMLDRPDPDLRYALALPLTPGEDGARLDAGAERVGRDLRLDLAAYLERAGAKGEAGEVVSVPVIASSETGGRLDEVLLVGTGDGSPAALRRAGAGTARRVGKGTTTVASAVVGAARDEAVRAYVEGYALASYAYSRAAGDDRGPIPLDLHVRRPGQRAEAARRALVTARSVHLTRDLGNEPADVKSPAWLAEVTAAAASAAGLTIRVRDETALAAEGFGGVLAVGQGSVRPPRLIELAYRPSGQGRAPHVVLVGKGITFDTGGISLKPNQGMLLMKMDMAAGAAIIGSMTALRDLDVPVRVTALVAAAENMPSGTAQRPSDVITQYGGRTVEVLNTDAEGRLVLADALAYADRRLNPDAIIDLATLTGAGTMALGKRVAGYYATDERLAAALERASARSGDRIWRMPLVEDYRPAIDSDVADLANIATDKAVGAGSITAALFLREFVGMRPWVHLDMSGPAKTDKDDDDLSRGATGFGVRLLLSWLEAGAPGVRIRS